MLEWPDVLHDRSDRMGKSLVSDTHHGENRLDSNFLIDRRKLLGRWEAWSFREKESNLMKVCRIVNLDG